MKRLPRVPVLVGAAAAVLVAGVGTAAVAGGGEPTTITADFANPIGVYEGNPVTVLGVQVGKVVGLEPDGTVVHVTIELQDGVQVPADAQAAVVQPSLVNSRSIALTPAYSGGEALADGARIGVDRTFAPVELDEILGALQELSGALGPNGANADGSVNDLLRTGARVLDGQGEQANETIRQLATMLGTLDTNRDDVKAVVANLADLLKTVADSNTTVTTFERSLAGAASTLADEREMFGAAVSELGVALGQLTALVRDHRDELGADVQALADISATLVAHQRDLMETLDVLPLGLANLRNAVNPETGRLDIVVPSEDFTPALCEGVLNNSLPGASTLLDLLRALPGVGEVTQQSCQVLLGVLLPVVGDVSSLAPEDLGDVLGEVSRVLDLLPLTGLLPAATPPSTTAPAPHGGPATGAVPVPDLGLGSLLAPGGAR